MREIGRFRGCAFGWFVILCAAASGAPDSDPPADPYTGLFKDEKITLQVTGADGRYRGSITMGDRRYPFSAERQGGKAVGQFKVDDSAFDVVLVPVEGGLKLTTGSTTYTLKKPGAAPATQEAGAAGGETGGGADVIPPGKMKLTRAYVPGQYIVESSLDSVDTAGNVVIRNLSNSASAVVIQPPDADGNIKMTVRTARMRTMLQAIGTNVEYDTGTRQGNHPSGPVLQALIGVPFEVTVGPTGRVDKVAGLDEWIKQVAEQNEAAGAMVGTMKDAIRGGLESAAQVSVTRLFPSKPVGSGDTWSAGVPLNLPAMGEQDVKGKATLSKVQGDRGLIDFEGKIKPDAPPGTAIEISLTTSSQIDVKTGMVWGSKAVVNSLFVQGRSVKKTVVNAVINMRKAN